MRSMTLFFVSSAAALSVGSLVACGEATAGTCGESASCAESRADASTLPDASPHDATSLVDGGADRMDLADVVPPPPDGPCAPDGFPRESPCTVDDAHGVFVSSSLGSTTGTGSKASPFNTLNAALQAAAVAGKRVYACAEDYHEDVVLPDKAALFGYFDCAGGAWSAAWGHASVTSLTDRALSATSLSGARVESFTFETPDQAAGSSKSAYGMFVVGSADIVLTHVVLKAGNGGTGADGSLGAAPAAQSGSCAAGNGAPSTTRTDGPSTIAQYTITGYEPAKGADGIAGTYGANGTTGGAKSCHTTGTCVTNIHLDPPCSADVVCTTAGTSGCGGPGGANGLGGAGGGASIALYAWASTITMEGGELVASSGGNGGAGGTGAEGASTWPSQAGSLGDSMSWSGGCVSTTNCTTPSVGGIVVGGAAGGNGGRGAPGGHGAGGGGGDVYAFYRGASAQVTAVTTARTRGAAGKGGGSAGAPGPNGVSAESN